MRLLSKPFIQPKQTGCIRMHKEGNLQDQPSIIGIINNSFLLTIKSMKDLTCGFGTLKGIRFDILIYSIL